MSGNFGSNSPSEVRSAGPAFARRSRVFMTPSGKSLIVSSAIRRSFLSINLDSQVWISHFNPGKRVSLVRQVFVESVEGFFKRSDAILL